MVIYQGDIYWINLKAPIGSGPGLLHPCVVIQNNLLNQSKIKTTVVCVLTSNLKRTLAPGNVTLAIKEDNLSKQSVVNVSQIFTIDKTQLQEKIGRLSPARIREIIAGVRFVIEPRTLDKHALEATA